MTREKKLLKNTLIISIGKICTQLITFFLLPLYTSILTTKEYGIIELLNTLVALMLPIVTFQIEQAVFRELIENRVNEDNKERIITSSIISVTIQCIIYLIVFLLISPLINNNYKYFLATNVIAYIYTSLFLQIARGIGDNKKYALGSFISALSTIIFNLIFVLLIQWRANGVLFGTLLGQIVCAIYLFIFLKLYKYIKIKKFDKKLMVKLWKYSIPLIPNAISWWVFSASDRLIVSAILGLSSTGILSAATKFSNVYTTLYNIFNLTWTESISVHINDSDIKDYFNKMFDVMIRLFSALGIGIIACVPFVFNILINAKFNESYNLIPILIVASFFNVVVGLISVIYIAKKNTKAIAKTSIISAIINIIVHLSLIKFIGLYAAAISTLVAFIIICLNRLNDINKKYFKIEFNHKLLNITILVLFAVLYSYYLDFIILKIISLVLAIVYAIMANKKTFGTLISMLKTKISKKVTPTLGIGE